MPGKWHHPKPAWILAPRQEVNPIDLSCSARCVGFLSSSLCVGVRVGLFWSIVVNSVGPLPFRSLQPRIPNNLPRLSLLLDAPKESFHSVPSSISLKCQGPALMNH